MLPIVAIVGRPNVGKSSLLNRIAGRLISIVDPTPGVTRDRVSTICQHRDCYFELVDTGGYGIEDVDDLTGQIEHQIRLAVEQAHLVIFLLDGRDGVLALDRAVADLLRPRAESVVMAVNKSDTPAQDAAVGEFYRLGFGEPLPISARHNRGIADLLDRVADYLGGHGLTAEADEAREPELKLAIVGKRNAGKSTLINAIAGVERVIVSEVPGTTRDSIDVRFVKDGRTILAIDTAGVRKKARIKTDIDFYSFSRAQRSIRRSDVVLLLIDAALPISTVDKKLGQYLADQFKPTIIVVNKFDLAKGRADSDDYADYVGKLLPGLSYAPIVLTTATEGRNVQTVLDLAVELFKQASTRVTTGQLNETLARVTGEEAPASLGLRRPGGKIYYATQVAVRPPTVVLFVHDVERITPQRQRFLLHRLRDALPFKEVPIRLLIRGRSRREAGESPRRPPREKRPAAPRNRRR